jgi:deoxyribonuclease V
MRAATSHRYGAVDVHYPDTGGASAALVIAADPTLARIQDEVVIHLDQARPYQPGLFYLRELPPIRAVLAAAKPLELLVIDGYVDLDPNRRPGLGRYVHEHTDIPVIGIAKTRFRAATHARAVTRGSATRPLYVTAAGIPIDDAVALVTAMSGRYRLPDAMRRADALARAASTTTKRPER